MEDLGAPDVGSLKIYGPLGLFCLFLIGVAYVLWRAIGKKDEVIKGFVMGHQELSKAHMDQVFEMLKANREQTDKIVREHREELVKLARDYKEELSTMVDRVVESAQEQTKKLSTALDRQLSLAESLDRKLDVRR